MGIKQLYNDNLWKLPNKYGDVSVMPNKAKTEQMTTILSKTKPRPNSWPQCYPKQSQDRSDDHNAIWIKAKTEQLTTVLSETKPRPNSWPQCYPKQSQERADDHSAVRNKAKTDQLTTVLSETKPRPSRWPQCCPKQSKAGQMTTMLSKTKPRPSRWPQSEQKVTEKQKSEQVITVIIHQSRMLAYHLMMIRDICEHWRDIPELSP